MKTTTETMERRPGMELAQRCEALKEKIRNPKNVKPHTKDLKPLPVSVQGAPDEAHPVATRKPA
ncbi:hypothetical protein [Armatimonas sp.]|uniref:hypothetical protein n=1 Tax=Armatimonas sp. TaxID=1872638 RepID=UPI00374CBBF8